MREREETEVKLDKNDDCLEFEVQDLEERIMPAEAHGVCLCSSSCDCSSCSCVAVVVF